ncbi:MAG: thioredoxin domain-containing protein [Chloroflexota bacterium]|nr:thioredoxin domain-containing protein [Chloroflexota bacterium]
MVSVTTRSLLFLAMGLLITACSASTQAQVATPVSLAGETNAPALAAAERGELGKPVIVFFHAQWCHICQKVRPDVAALEEAYRDSVVVVRMDIDAIDSRAAVGRYRVSATPTFVLLSAQGSMLATIPGWPGKAGMERTIAQMLETD